MNFLLKTSSFSKIRLPFFNFRKFSLEGVYSHYNDLCNIDNEINKIFSTDHFNFKRIDYLLMGISSITRPLNRKVIFDAFSKITKTVEQKQLTTSSSYYLYILHFMTNMNYDFDPTAILKEMASKGLPVNKNILHQILVKYSFMGDLKSAKLLHDCYLSNFGPNTYHYVFLICAAIRARNYKAADEYRKALNTVEPRLPRYMLGNIMDTYASVCDIDKCIETFKEMEYNLIKFDNPYKEIYKMYLILAKSGASKEDLLKAIEFLKDHINFGRIAILINNLFRSNLFHEAIFFIENIDIKISVGHWKTSLRLLILYHNPPMDVYEYFYNKAAIYNLDYIYIAQEFSFEDAIKAMNSYFFSESQNSNAKLVCGLLYNASKSDNSILKLKTALLFCRLKFRKPEFSSYLIVYWLDSIKKYYKMNYSTIIASLEDEFSEIDKRFFILCCILNSLYNNETSETKQLIQDYPSVLQDPFLFNHIFLASRFATNIHFDNFQYAVSIFHAIIAPYAVNTFFDRYIVVSCKRFVSEKVISMIEYLLANSSYNLTENSISEFSMKDIPETSFMSIKALYDKNNAGFSKDKP